MQQEEQRTSFTFQQEKTPKQMRSVLQQNEFWNFYLLLSTNEHQFPQKHEKTPTDRGEFSSREVLTFLRGSLFKGHCKIVHLSTTAVLKALLTWLSLL